MSGRQRLIRQRVARARELLESGDLPIEQIAGQVGFTTAASPSSRDRIVTQLRPGWDV